MTDVLNASEAAASPAWPVMTLAQAHAQLTAPGQRFDRLGEVPFYNEDIDTDDVPAVRPWTNEGGDLRAGGGADDFTGGRQRQQVSSEHIHPAQTAPGLVPDGAFTVEGYGISNFLRSHAFDHSRFGRFRVSLAKLEYVLQGWAPSIRCPKPTPVVVNYPMVSGGIAAGILTTQPLSLCRPR